MVPLPGKSLHSFGQRACRCARGNVIPPNQLPKPLPELISSHTPKLHRSMKSTPTSILKTIGRIYSSAIRTIALFAGIAVAATLPSCGPSPDAYNIPSAAFTATPSGVLAVGDVLRFSYAGAPEFNQTQKIQPDGRVSLPTVGNIKAAGRSVSSLQASLTELYRPSLNDPTVVVAVEQPAAAVYVSGEVNTPGKVPLDRQLSALEAVMEAGGFSKLANPSQVFVIRTEGGTQKRYALNLNATLSGLETRPFYLRPFDVIYVKKSNW
ncbi:MAG: polysaccharide export protein [Verrucomicrobiaceae bacterium]|nr:MAG: polysaccharide export protein [Verrucomicrobiaceae bacterium]